MAVSGHALGDHAAVKAVERRKQGGRAVALVIVGHRLAASLFERQAGLGAIEGLDLGLLIERENQSMLRRIEIESDDVVEFLGETRVIAELEGLDAVGLEAMGAPNPSHGGSADAGRGGHGAAAPVGGVGRFLAGGLVDDLLYFLLRDGRCTTGPWGVFCNAGNAAFEKARAPAGHQLPRDTELCGYLPILETVGGQQDNPGSQGETNGDLAAARVAVQLLAVRCVQSYWLCSSHPMPPVNRDDGKPI